MGLCQNKTLKMLLERFMIHAGRVNIAMYIKVVEPTLCVDLLPLFESWNTRGIITSMEYG